MKSRVENCCPLWVTDDSFQDSLECIGKINLAMGTGVDLFLDVSKRSTGPAISYNQSIYI
jgi:hypothetical protein